MVQRLPEFGVRFGCALRAQNRYRLPTPASKNSGEHRDPVIAEGIGGSAREAGRSGNDEPVGKLVCASAKGVYRLGHRMQPVGFLQPEPCRICNSRFALGIGRDSRDGGNQVRNRTRVNVDSVER